MAIEMTLPLQKGAAFDLTGQTFHSDREKQLATAPGYPQRAEIPLARRPWQREYADYKPVFFEAPRVLEMDRSRTAGGWADPADISPQQFRLLQRAGGLKSYEGPLQLDAETGRPLNPAGRTGIAGRGMLGKWGANQAADALLTRINPDSGQLEALLVLRECGRWAVPGGMLDDGEDSITAALRELDEEAKVHTGEAKGQLIYQGLAEGPRMTDNAWIETTLYHFHFDAQDPASGQVPEPGVDVHGAEWFPVSTKLIESLYANHGEMLAIALAQFRLSRHDLSEVVIAQLDQVQHAPILTSFSQLHGKIGVVGGTFDLLHAGHLYTGLGARKMHDLDAIVFIPAAHNPLKQQAPQAVARERFEMLCEAVSEMRNVFVSPIEVRKEGPSYTVDTVAAIREQLPSDSQLFLIVGEDCLAQLPRWYQIDRIRQMASFIPVGRAGFKELSREDITQLLGSEFAEQSVLERVPSLGIEISSTDLRERIRNGEDTENAIPPAVLRYINEHQLYQGELVH